MSLDKFKDTVVGKIPVNWDLVSIGDQLDLITDYHSNGSYKTLKKHVDLKESPDYALMVRTTNFEQNNFTDSLRYVDKSAYEFLEKSKVYPNDIIMNKIANAGSVYLMPDLKRPVSLAMNLFLLRMKPTVNQRYVYYYLKHNEKYLKTFAQGSVTKTITKENVKRFPLVVPPLDVQNKIDYILSLFYKKILTLENINKNLTKLSSIIFINLMEKSDEFLELNECCKFIKGKKPKETSEYPQSNFLDYLTIDVLSNQSQMYAYDEKGILANEYDILMVMDGASSGKLFYGKSGLVGSTLAKLNVEEKYLEIVYQFLKQSEKFISDNTTGSAIPHTDKGLVLNLKCPISEELLNHSDMFKSMRSSIIINNREILKLQKLRDTLLPKLMSGEIDVSKINCDLIIFFMKIVLIILHYLHKYYVW